MVDVNTEVEDFLTHHGVKGQRWGVRHPESFNRVHRVSAGTETRKLNINRAKSFGGGNKDAIGKEIRNKQNKIPLTKQERIQRNNRRVAIAKFSVRVVATSLFVAAILASNHSTPVNHIKVNKPQSVADIINAERNVKVSSLKRMHKEGKMDSDQAKNFLKILNDRYDKKIVDAMK